MVCRNYRIFLRYSKNNATHQRQNKVFWFVERQIYLDGWRLGVGMGGGRGLVVAVESEAT